MSRLRHRRTSPAPEALTRLRRTPGRTGESPVGTRIAFSPSVTEPLHDTLLATLRDELGDAVSYREPPTLIGSGAEARIYEFRLSGVEGPFAEPLVARCIEPALGSDQLPRELAAHRALERMGYPAPRVFACRDDSEPGGERILVMTRLLGAAPLAGVLEPGGVSLKPWTLLPQLREALFGVPALMGGTQAMLHSLDPQPMREAFSEAGFGPERFTPRDELEKLGARIEKLGLDGLRPAIEWLDECEPAATAPAICHGDFVFVNFFVYEGEVTVFDWSRVCIGHPAYDVAATTSRLSSPIPELPALLGAIFRRAQVALQRRYLAAYARSRPLDIEALHYYEVQHFLGEIVWGLQGVAAGRHFDGRLEHRWLHPEIRQQGLARLAARIGRALDAPY